MKIKENDFLELKLKVFRGKPIKIDGVGELKPHTIDEILDVGYTKYNSYFNCLTVNIHDLIKGIQVPDGVKFTTFDLLGTQSVENNFQQVFLEAIKFFFRKDKAIFTKSSSGVGVILFDEEDTDYFIYRDNFPYIQDILRLQNGLDVKIEEEDDDDEKLSPRAKAIRDKLRKAKEQVEEVKKKKEIEENSNVDLHDIISSITAKSNSINKFNVWDLTLYQLYDEYKRLEFINQYEVNLEAIMNGAEDIELKHWSGKLE